MTGCSPKLALGDSSTSLEFTDLDCSARLTSGDNQFGRDPGILCEYLVEWELSIRGAARDAEGLEDAALLLKIRAAGLHRCMAGSLDSEFRDRILVLRNIGI